MPAVPSDFRELFETHYARVRRQAGCILNDADAAEDIAQETFCRLLLNPPRQRVNVGGWLSRVATNLALNHLRGRRSRTQREETAGRRWQPGTLSAEEQVLRSERLALARQALAGLSERERLCLLLRFSGMSYAEVAEAIGIKINSVGTVLTRAEAKFRRRYTALNGGTEDVF
ncbi:RNA polymerase sigma factor SigX [Desulforudis sp. 1088]|uniref:RNA polymerase sigma factor SigX n=1 Tax=unclassified Candidatus Desulforudis TaxID=2635950 RepID=UPI0034742F39